MAITDERVQFYLRYRDQLEEWFSLRSEVAGAVDTWLTALEDEGRTLAAELGDGVLFRSDVYNNMWPGIYLSRPEWPAPPDKHATIGLQWVRGKTLLGESTSPYVGVYCERAAPVGRALRDDPGFAEIRRRRKDKTNAWWTAWAYIRPEQPFPDNAEAFRMQLVDALRECWTTYGETVDRAVARAAASPFPAVDVEPTA